MQGVTEEGLARYLRKRGYRVLGVELKDGTFQVIVPFGETLPTRHGQLEIKVIVAPPEKPVPSKMVMKPAKRGFWNWLRRFIGGR